MCDLTMMIYIDEDLIVYEYMNDLCMNVNHKLMIMILILSPVCLQLTVYRGLL